MPRPSDDLETRYGRRAARSSTRHGLIVVAVILIGVGVAWAWWASQAASGPPVSAEVRSFDVRNAHSVEVTLHVRRGEPGPATCQVRAQAMDHAVVGEKAVELPRKEQSTPVETLLRTERRAATVTVEDCRLSG